MIRLIQEEHRYTTSWCKACSVKYGHPLDNAVDDQTACLYCLGYLVTTFMCPDCGLIDQFLGYATPEECPTCAIKFPDFDTLKSLEEERIEYHLNEALF